jgi:hypothetical protein
LIHDFTHFLSEANFFTTEGIIRKYLSLPVARQRSTPDAGSDEATQFVGARL